MSNFLLMRAGYEPVNINAESRARYIAAIRAFQEEDDPYPFVAFFCLNLTERLEKVLGLLDADAGARDDAEWRASGIDDYLGSSGSAESDIPKYHGDTLGDTLEIAILSLVRDDPSIGQSEIADRVGKSVPTVKRAMKHMSDAGIIRRTGGKRYGSWEVL